MSKIDARCSCGAEMHARFWHPQSTANCYQAFMDEHAACRNRTVANEGVSVLGFPADGTPLAAAMDRLQEAKRSAQRVWNKR